MIVKVCGITNRDDAEFAVRAGATALGFNFYKGSPRVIDPDKAADIINALPSSVLKVGIFVNESPEMIEQVVARTGLDVAQVIGSGPSSGRCWKVHRVDASFTANSLDDSTAEAFLLDTPSATEYGGTGRTFDWSRARIDGKKIIIAGGLGPDNVARAIQECRPWGVDACSRLERAPGLKDAAKVQEFISAALSV